MAYEARRDDDLEKMRNDQNNANNVRNAADVAMASGNPYAMAAGAAVKIGDRVSGGKVSQELGRGLSKVNEHAPLGNRVQDASNKLSESGASDRIGQAAAVKNMASGKNPGETPNQVAHSGGGEQTSSLPSSDGKNQIPVGAASGAGTDTNGSKNGGSGVSEESSGSSAEYASGEEKKQGKGLLGFLGKQAITAVLIMALPVIVLFLSFMIVLSAASGVFGEFEDAFGMSDVSGEETGGVGYDPSSQDQKEFYERVERIKNEYLEQGVEVDTVKVVGVFHIINNHNTSIDYKKIQDAQIRTVIDSMFLEGIYDENTFKENLIYNILPTYIPEQTENDYQYIADEIITYINDYYDLIGKPQDNASGAGVYCSTESGTCSYEIKGYAIPGKGNVSEKINPSNIYVRLMQCGKTATKNYGGTTGEAMEGEALVPFEKYVLGASYAALGANASSEAFKAQTVALRSFILARHADKGSWRTLKEENGRWILQAANCEVDPIYCDPDKGCSADSGGQVHSGLENKGKFRLEALSQNSPLRSYAASTEGEVLTNAQGYIVYSDYSGEAKEKFKSLAEKGANYKQILLQVYNQQSHKYDARKISSNTCKSANEDKECISTGEYSGWKQGSAAWGNIPVGNSGRNIRQIGCLATAVAIQIARSGVATKVDNFNPGTFVQYLNNNGGFASGGNFVWRSAEKVAPTFKYQNRISIAGLSQKEKLARIRELTSQKGVYVVAEVKGNTGQHWVAIDSVNGNTINMMDPGSDSTNMWTQYHWANTSELVYYKVS